jgi:hypothetical protein
MKMFICRKKDHRFHYICVYISDGLLVLNKPYGLGLSPPSTTATKQSHQTDKMIAGQRQYYLTEALPHIAGNLGYNSLTVLKTPERFVLFFYNILKLHIIVNDISV